MIDNSVRFWKDCRSSSPDPWCDQSGAREQPNGSCGSLVVANGGCLADSAYGLE